jgi:molybdopterin-binding protein
MKHERGRRRPEVEEGAAASAVIKSSDVIVAVD